MAECPSRPPEKSPGELLDAIFQAYARSDQPGFVVGVAKHGRTIYRKAFGLASLQHGIANTPDTRMRIGSTTKHMACLAGLLLAEEGKLDLDAPATRWLPELPPLAGVPTLRQFMNHTSGYRCSIDLATTGNGHAMIPRGEQIARLFSQREVNFAPGTAQLYCNGGYHLLSLAIDRVSGTTLEKFMKERLFEPLGMHQTDAVPSDMTIVPGMASMHVPDPAGGWRRGIFPTEEIRGEGNVVSTVDDMLRWLAHFDVPRKVGSDESWRQLHETATMKNGLRSVYALGLNLFRWRGVDLICHSGGVIGGACQMMKVPAHGYDIVILSNGAPVSPIQLAYDVVVALLGDALEPAAEIPPAAGHEHLDGVNYFGPSGVLVGFGRVGDYLGFRYLAMPPLPVLKRHGDRLRVGFEEVAIGPVEIRLADLHPAADGAAPAHLDYFECGNVERLERLTPPADPLRAFARLAGRYWSHDLDASAALAMDGDSLRVRFRGGHGRRSFTAQALSESVFILTADGDGSETLLLWTEPGDGPSPHFRVESLRARHLRFDRAA
jgi:CubicO group peptidase (beta-lactamase class C family)